MRNLDLLVTPGAIIGYRKNGCPIRLIAGGAPEDEDQGGGGQDGGQQDGGQGQPGPGNGDGGNGGTGTGGGQPQQNSGGPARQDDDAAARTIAAVRADFKTERAKRQALEKDVADFKTAQATAAEQTTARNLALARALGLKTDEPPDPEKLTAELEKAQAATQAAIDKSTARERELVVENQLLRAARKHGADPERLADSRSFMAKLGGLDPGSDSFAEDLGDVIKTAVTDNPGFKVAGDSGGSTGASNAAGTGKEGDQGDHGAEGKPGKPARTTAPPARSGSGSGHNGSPGGNRQWTDDDVDRASPRETEDAQAAGLLTDLGFPPKKQKRR